MNTLALLPSVRGRQRERKRERKKETDRERIYVIGSVLVESGE